MPILTTQCLDELTLAMFAGVELPALDFAVEQLVPFSEWAWLKGSHHMAHTVQPSGRLAGIDRDLRLGQALSGLTIGATSGFVRIRRAQEDVANSGWLGFLAMFSRAAQASGLSKRLADQLTGVVKEMEDNVHLHSDRPSSGLVAFLSHPGMFEFVVADRGIGVLASLQRAPEFSELADHGTALQLAVSEGTSRYGSNAARGMGFSEITVGVANSNALVRFRSGDHLLELDGRGNGTITTRCVPRAAGQGFVIAVQVHSD